MNIYSNTTNSNSSQRQVPSHYENVANLSSSNISASEDESILYANIDNLPLPPPPPPSSSLPPPTVNMANFDSTYLRYDPMSNDYFPPPPPPPNSMEPMSYMNNVERFLAGYRQQQEQHQQSIFSGKAKSTNNIYANIGNNDDNLIVNNIYDKKMNPIAIKEDRSLYKQIDRLNFNDADNKFFSSTRNNKDSETLTSINDNNNSQQRRLVNLNSKFPLKTSTSTSIKSDNNNNNNNNNSNNNNTNSNNNIYANTGSGNSSIQGNANTNCYKSNPLPIKNYLRVNRSSASKGEEEVDHLTDLLVKSMENAIEPDFFGMCHKCGEKVVGEGSGCTAMKMVYHIQCFTCFECHKELRGKSFYAMESNPFCEECYLNTLEKCCVCEKPILERILRATGKPYHPNCFTCVVCKKCLDGIPFTVDANNQIHCIDDFHKKFAPRCSVCKEPIVPEPGKTETVRVVALDRSFHVSCYKCEDCDLLLSSEAEGRGCYPLDDHILCRNCNTKRVQALTAN